MNEQQDSSDRNLSSIFFRYAKNQWRKELPSDWIVIEVSSYNEDSNEYPYTIFSSNPSFPSHLSSNSSSPTLTIINETNKGILPKPIVQELICPKNQNLQKGCYVILDGPDVSGSGFSRFLIMEPMGQIAIAEAPLDFPLHGNFTRENSRQWPLLSKKPPPIDYQRALVVQPFITQTFEPSLMPSKIIDGKTRRILCLGLHGSVVNNFFANLSTKYDVTTIDSEPALRYISEKWFGFSETEQNRIFVENPAFYVVARAELIENPKTVAVPKRFDFIVIDVCYGLGDAENRRVQCPIKEFEEEKVISALAKNLAPYGTIVMHFFSLSSKLDIPAQHQLANHEHQILQLFKKYFGNCYFVSVGPHLLLTCTRRAQITRADYITTYRKLPKELQIYAENQEPKFFLDLEAI
uniref:PABS domain-containing protein n=1 Tax=Meloidogyne hapla TaxID=6305 RepID=A0A1I8BMU2_MELHA